MHRADGRTTTARVLVWASMLVFAASSLGMAARMEPFFTWFFLFAWWSYILGLESFLFLRSGYSVLFEEPRRFLFWLPLSIFCWLVFELFNLRLDNWGYLNLPSQTPLRWFGYAASFATVLPGLFVTERLLSFLGAWEESRTAPWPWPAEHPRTTALAGAAMLILPLVWPRYCFPLVWGGVLLLADPISRALGGESLLDDLARSRPGRIFRLLLAGFICGVLWESWNYFAGAKWFYTVPFVGEIKLFEMPVLGFLGFPPFALECFAMAALADALARRGKRLGQGAKMAMWTMIHISFLVFSGFVFYCIDRYTTVSLVPFCL